LTPSKAKTTEKAKKYKAKAEPAATKSAEDKNHKVSK
jgi:hypothetical protein